MKKTLLALALTFTFAISAWGQEGGTMGTGPKAPPPPPAAPAPTQPSSDGTTSAATEPDGGTMGTGPLASIAVDVALQLLSLL